MCCVNQNKRAVSCLFVDWFCLFIFSNIYKTETTKAIQCLCFPVLGRHNTFFLDFQPRLL